MIDCFKAAIFSLFFSVFCVFPSQLLANGFFDQFLDPEDGMLDASSWLLGGAHLEAHWNLSARWSVLGFAGVGRASFRDNNLSDAESRWAGGTGMRYLTAKALKLYTGIDIAKGPEEWVFYLQMGNAWNM